MQVIFRILFSMVFIALMGCAHQGELVLKHKSQKMCYNACLERVNACGRLCHNDCKTCAYVSHGQAKHRFDRFIKELLVKGGILSRELNSFHDPLQCRKPTCDCLADYNVCMQACKGTIYKQLQVPSACC